MAALHWRKLPEKPPLGVDVLCFFRCPEGCPHKHVPIILHLALKGKSMHEVEWVSTNDGDATRFSLHEVGSWAYVEPPPWR